MDLHGKTALVTGASSGLGVEFAKQLATMGANVVIAARRLQNLERLKEEIEAASRVTVTPIEVDLADPTAPARLFEDVGKRAGDIDILVNNAGGGVHQNFLDLPWERTLSQLQVNVVSLTELTFRFGAAMRQRGGGYILNVSSIGAYTPTPTYATYSAGKAYVRDFSEAVAYELRGSPVRVCCLCPGGVFTEFHQRAGQEPSKTFRFTFFQPDECAKVGLDALFSGRISVVNGVMNKLSMWMTRFMPRRTLAWSAALTMGPPKRDG